MNLTDNHASLRAAGKNMTFNLKRVLALAALAALAAVGSLWPPSLAAEGDGVALAIIYDTSGSMHDPVRDRSGEPAPKYVIANRALLAIARQIQAFVTNSASGAPRTIHTALFVFSGASARQAIKFGPFDAIAIEDWATRFSSPNGSTPLGNSLTLAGQVVLESPLPHKHILVITDGMNTAGPKPEDVLPVVQRRARDKGTSMSVHFVAFDVDAKVFAPVKKLGATVVGAADEKQLNTQLDFIMQRKIL